MELLIFWMKWGIPITFVMLLIEYLLGYDRTYEVISANPHLEQYETIIRIGSTIMLVIIWPWTVINFLIGFVKGFIQAFRDE